MKNKALTAVILLALAACGNNAPKTDLNQQEQAAVDSTMSSDEAAMDSLEAAIMSQIGEDTTAEESHEDHEGHNHPH